MKSISIFTDGASRGNPGPGGWGAIIVLTETVKELGGGEKRTTNNRMELTAVIEALAFLSKLKIKEKELVVNVFTDSSYVLKGAMSWVYGWERNGWKTKQKDEVLNKDLWVKLLKLISISKINWQLLPGHSGIPGNERCDIIATTFADGLKIQLYSGNKSGYKIDVSSVIQTKAKKRKSSKSKVKPYSYVSSVNGAVKTHRTWAECESRTKGKSGALFKKSFSKEDEKAIIALWKRASHF